MKANMVSNIPPDLVQGGYSIFISFVQYAEKYRKISG